MIVYRVAQARFAHSVEEMLSGEGAAEHGGRWNSIGVPAIYCAESLALSALELLVHLPRGALTQYRYLQITVPDEALYTVDTDASEDISITQTQGDALLGPNGVLAFCVASAVLPLAQNLVLNPLHVDMDRVGVGEIQDLPIDKRLLNR